MPAFQPAFQPAFHYSTFTKSVPVLPKVSGWYISSALAAGTHDLSKIADHHDIAAFDPSRKGEIFAVGRPIVGV